MLNKIRTDIASLFSKNRLLTVNADLFSIECEADNYYKDIWQFNSKELFSELKNVGVKVFFYGSECPFIKQNRKLIEQNNHEVLSSEDLDLNDGFIIISPNFSDKPIVTKSEFSVTSPSAPLELKMISSYVSNFDGEYVFREIGNLFVRCRS